MIITESEYDQLYKKVKQEVLADIEKEKNNVPYRKDYEKFVGELEDRLFRYLSDNAKVHHTKSAVYTIVKLALRVQRFEDFKRLGLKDVRQFTVELFELIDKYNASR